MRHWGDPDVKRYLIIGKREKGKEEKKNALEGERERESARGRKGWLARGRKNARRSIGG